MARPYVFSIDTTLYHPTEGARTFPQGETDPGPAWSDKPGGDRSEGNTMASAAKDLIAANDRADALGVRLEAQAHDLAVAAKARENAEAKVAGLEQRAIEAEKALDAAIEAARGYMQERDSARAEVQSAKANADAAEALVNEANERAAAVVAQLEAANQASADLKDQLAAKKATKADPAPAA